MPVVGPNDYVECCVCWRPIPTGTQYSGSKPKCYDCAWSER